MAEVNPAIIELWSAALNSPKGIWVRSPDTDRLKVVLYSTRQWIMNNGGDPRLLAITVNTSVTDPKHEVWLIKRGDALREP